MPIQKLGRLRPARAAVMQSVSTQPLAADAGDDAEDAHDQADEEAAEGELKREGEFGGDEAGDGLAAAETVAEVADEGVGEEAAVLRGDRDGRRRAWHERLRRRNRRWGCLAA
jgi:hypothetical protein